MLAHGVQLDVPRSLGGGFDVDGAESEQEAEHMGIERFHVRDLPVIHVVDAASQQVLVLENKAHVRQVNHVVREVAPPAPQEHEGKQDQRDADGNGNGIGGRETKCGRGHPQS
mgnify:CR=1 FL=1